MDNDHIDISNENFHEYTDKTKLENSSKWKRRFIYIMQMNKKESYVSILSESDYVQLLHEVQEFKICPSQVSTYQAKRLAKLDILNNRLIMKQIHKSHDIRYFLKIDEVFDVLEKVHIRTGHRGRDRIKKEVCTLFANITTDMINLFLSMCQTCRNRRINHKRRFLDEVDLRRLDVCCNTVNNVTLATTSQVMDINCEETIKEQNTSNDNEEEEVHEHDEDDNENVLIETDNNANANFEKSSFEPLTINQVFGTLSSNGFEEEDDDNDDDEDDDGNAVIEVQENGIYSVDEHEPNEAADDDHDNSTDENNDGEEEEEDDDGGDDESRHHESRSDLSNMISTEGQKIIIDYDDDGNDGDNDDDGNDGDDDDDEEEDEEDDLDEDDDNDNESMESESVNDKKSQDNSVKQNNNNQETTVINITDNLPTVKPQVTDPKTIETVININTNESKNETTAINRNINENNQQVIVNNAKSDVSMTITTIDINSTNDKKKSIIRKPSVEIALPARRSLRNVNKRKVDDDIELLPPQLSKVAKTAAVNFSDDDVQVIDLGESKTSSSAINNTSNKSTIFVNDTKHLARIAAKTGGMKKEPTLVIIDTKSSSNSSSPASHLISSTLSSNRGSGTGGSTISIINKKQPSLSLISSASKASITAINTSNSKMKTNQYQQHSHDNNVLPSLTDDMFVVEAPSFIVPYVYEKPSTKSLKDFLNEYKKEIEANSIEKKKKKLDRTKRHKDDKDRVPKNTDNSKEKGDSSDENSSTTTITSSSENESEEFDSDEPLKQNSLIKKIDNKNASSAATTTLAKGTTQTKKSHSESTSYFESPIGKFLIKIGFNLVREPVQEDLLRHQKRMKNKTAETEQNIASLMKNIALSKEQNEVFKHDIKKCDHCTFKTESILVLLHHLQKPHMRNNMYFCSYCKEETTSVELIVKHTTLRHQIHPWLENLPSPFQCSLCPFEDFQRGKLSRHVISCAKRFRIEDNLAPPLDWEPPAKIPRVPRVKQTGLAGAASAYQLMAAQQNKLHHFPFHPQHQSLHHQQQSHRQTSSALPLTSLYQKNRNNKLHSSGSLTANALHFSRLNTIGTSSSITTTKSILPKSLSMNTHSGHSNNKALHHPSISITPLPRQGTLSNSNRLNTSGGTMNVSAGSSDHNSSLNSNAGVKPTFVICEICDGYIKDLEMLRNHMQWIHKVKIHPKMIYNRPPLNCQKCQFRFFTDQGLERHLLGSHGLVTSSMQEAANKSKDAGRCPICGKVYQWKLLNHVDKEHKMPLKPAHLSYKCTVCTATFGMYKEFENHVYSSHSMVAKKLMDKKSQSSAVSSGGNNNTSTSSTSQSNKSSDSFKSAMKFNDEITIIPQPAKK